jgi:hypothetical protein
MPKFPSRKMTISYYEIPFYKNDYKIPFYKK